MAKQQINYTSQQLMDWLPRLAGASALIVGDVMLDEYFIGDAERISPEAPVPVVKISDDRLLLGGAGNVARNMRGMTVIASGLKEGEQVVTDGQLLLSDGALVSVKQAMGSGG